MLATNFGNALIAANDDEDLSRTIVEAYEPHIQATWQHQNGSLTTELNDGSILLTFHDGSMAAFKDFLALYIALIDDPALCHIAGMNREDVVKALENAIASVEAGSKALDNSAAIR